MTNAHTPGPWKTYYAGPFNEDLIVMQNGSGAMYDAGCGSQVASISFQPGGAKGEEMVANARLIAAAPEMYEALKLLQQHWHHMLDVSSPPSWHALNGKMDAALAKVEGR